MSKKKPGWTAERHREVGRRLKVIRREIMDVALLLNDYPINGPAQQAASRAYQALDRLRMKLESLFARENPDQWTTDVYFGAEPATGRAGQELTQTPRDHVLPARGA